MICILQHKSSHSPVGKPHQFGGEGSGQGEAGGGAGAGAARSSSSGGRRGESKGEEKERYMRVIRMVGIVVGVDEWIGVGEDKWPLLCYNKALP